MNPENIPQGTSQQDPRGPQFVNYGSDTQTQKPPISVTPPSRQMYGNTYSAPKKSHKGLFFSLFIILIIILAIVYAVYAWVLRPDNTIKTIFNNIDSAQVISTNLKIDTISSSGEEYSATLLVDLDKTNPNALKNQTIVDISGEDFALGLEARYLNNMLYAQITNYPKEYADFVKGFANKWYSLKANGIKTSGTDNLYEKVVGSGAFTGMHFAGFSWGTEGLVRNYTVDVNPEIFSKSNTSKYENSLSQSSIPYASVVSSFAGNIAESAQISPITVSVGMFSGVLKQVSLSATDKASPAKATIVLKYDDTKSEIVIDAPSGAQSVDSLLAGLSAKN